MKTSKNIEQHMVPRTYISRNFSKFVEFLSGPSFPLCASCLADSSTVQSRCLRAQVNALIRCCVCCYSAAGVGTRPLSSDLPPSRSLCLSIHLISPYVSPAFLPPLLLLPLTRARSCLDVIFLHPPPFAVQAPAQTRACDSPSA